MNANVIIAVLGVLLVVASAAFFIFGRKAGTGAERERQAAIVAAENVAGVKAVEDALFCADPVSVVLVS